MQYRRRPAGIVGFVPADDSETLCFIKSTGGRILLIHIYICRAGINGIINQCRPIAAASAIAVDKQHFYLPAGNADKPHKHATVFNSVERHIREITRYQSLPDLTYYIVGQKIVRTTHRTLPYHHKPMIVRLITFSNNHFAKLTICFLPALFVPTYFLRNFTHANNQYLHHHEGNHTNCNHSFFFSHTGVIRCGTLLRAGLLLREKQPCATRLPRRPRSTVRRANRQILHLLHHRRHTRLGRILLPRIHISRLEKLDRRGNNARS